MTEKNNIYIEDVVDVKELQTLIEDIAVLESAQQIEEVVADNTPSKQDFINKKEAS